MKAASTLIRSDASAHKTSLAKSYEIRWLQAARGIAVLLVVLCHASAFVGQEPGLWQNTALYLCFRGGALGVQLFFVISGIAIFRAHRRDLDRPQQVRTFFWKRFRRIYPFYWICLTLVLLKHQASSDMGASYMHLPSVIASSYLLVHIFSFQTIMVQAWTLFDEVQFYLVFAVGILHRKAGLLILSMWLMASIFFLVPRNAYWSTAFSPYHLLFGLGILVSLALEKNWPLPASLLLWLGMLVFVAAVVIEGPFQRGIPIRLTAGVGAAALLYGGIMLERQQRLTSPRWLTLLGDASYSIYLVHFMVISAVARFAHAHMRQIPIPDAAWMLGLVLCGTATGLAAYYAVERPLLRLLGKS